MKQKVVTKAIIKQDGKILLLRRHGGRPSIAGLYELPGGRVHMQQQPEDALQHALRIHLKVSAETIQLDDVMSFVDPEDREIQYVFLLFQASLKVTDRDIHLSHEYDRYVWKKMSDIQLNEVTQSTQQLLRLTSIPFSQEVIDQTISSNDAQSTTHEYLIGYTDGGSRGNPGPSASGFVLMDQNQIVIHEGGAYLGITTNNIAEYQAVYLALQKALEFGAIHVDFRLDSLLVVNQLNGTYKIKHPDLAIINNRIVELSQQFEKVTFAHVRREYNRLADGMVNKILDQHQNDSL